MDAVKIDLPTEEKSELTPLNSGENKQDAVELQNLKIEVRGLTYFLNSI